MSDEAKVVWTDKRIVDEASKSPAPTEWHEVVTRAYCIGLCVEVRDEYEKELATLRTERDQWQQRAEAA